jgi:hypothetical protein
MRIGDPARRLLKPEARLDRRSEGLLRADILHSLPDPKTRWDAPNGHLRIRQGLGFLGADCRGVRRKHRSVRHEKGLLPRGRKKSIRQLLLQQELYGYVGQRARKRHIEIAKTIVPVRLHQSSLWK